MGAKSSQTIGFWYYLGIHFGLCRGPVDALVEIRGGNRTAWSGAQTASGRITIDAEDLWGGERAEGGLAGDLDVMMGEPTQAPNDYLTIAQAGPQPAYRGLCTAVYRRGKVGAFNPNPKRWSFRLQRALKGWDNNLAWYPEKAVINLPGGIKAMNPAHILYETIIDQRWGMGEPRSLIADAAWRAAADVLHAEGFGLSLIYEPTPDNPIRDFQQLVIDHIGAALTQSRADGLYYLDLIRPIADPLTLPQLTESDVLELTIEPNLLVDAVNEIRVEWRDPLTNTDRVATPVQALGNITSTQGVISETRTYRGIPTESLALRAALRDLNARALPLTRIQAVINRVLWDRRPGQAIRVSLPSEGIQDAVFRIGEIDFGALDDARMRVVLVQDVFAFPATVYAEAQIPLWTAPDPTPIVTSIARIDESTWRDVVQGISAGDQAVLAADVGFLAVSAARPPGNAVNYVLATASTGENFVERGTGDWSPSALLAAGVSGTATVWPLTASFGLDRVALGSEARVGREHVRIDAIDLIAQSVTVGRGCVDTVPEPHPAGEFVFFSDDFLGNDGREYSDGETVSVQILTRTFAQQIDPVEAFSGSVVMDARPNRPYPPGKVRLNGQAFPGQIASPLTVTWAHRDRLLQDDQLVDTEAASIGPEPNTQYRLLVEQPIGTVVSDQTTALTASTAVALSDGIPARMQLWSTRDGVESRYRHEQLIGVNSPPPAGTSTQSTNGDFESGLTGWSVVTESGGASSASLVLTTDPSQVIAGGQSGRLQRTAGSEITFVRLITGEPALRGSTITVQGRARRLDVGDGSYMLTPAIQIREAASQEGNTIPGGRLSSDSTIVRDQGAIVAVPDKGTARSLIVPPHPGDLVFDAGVLVQSPLDSIDLVLDDWIVTWFRDIFIGDGFIIEPLLGGSGDWPVPAGVTSVQVLVVGGGAGGGRNGGGGGGAGRVVFDGAFSTIPGGTVPYTVGSGGAAATAGTGAASDGGNGTDSIFGSIIALGGGGGGGASARPGKQGGSGGGGGNGAIGGLADASQGGLGNDGGNSTDNLGAGGGGAGAPGFVYGGGAGVDMSATFTANFGDNGWFGGGGAARGNLASPGGAGGGGDTEQDGMSGTGGGGGGGRSSFPVGKGGSGVILIRYPQP